MQKHIKYQCHEYRIIHTAFYYLNAHTLTQTQTYTRSLHDWAREYVTRTRTCGLLAIERATSVEDEAGWRLVEGAGGLTGESERVPAGEGQWIHSYMYEAKKLISKEK